MKYMEPQESTHIHCGILEVNDQHRLEFIGLPTTQSMLSTLIFSPPIISLIASTAVQCSIELYIRALHKN